MGLIRMFVLCPQFAKSALHIPYDYLYIWGSSSEAERQPLLFYVFLLLPCHGSIFIQKQGIIGILGPSLCAVIDFPPSWFLSKIFKIYLLSQMMANLLETRQRWSTDHASKKLSNRFFKFKTVGGNRQWNLPVVGYIDPWQLGGTVIKEVMFKLLSLHMSIFQTYCQYLVILADQPI